MKASELLNFLTSSEQLEALEKQSTVTFEEALENPEKLDGQVVAFLGNWAEYVTEGIVVRIIDYDPEYDEWTVYDLDLSDGFCDQVEYSFDKWEMKEDFPSLAEHQGYILEPEDD